MQFRYSVPLRFRHTRAHQQGGHRTIPSPIRTPVSPPTSTAPPAAPAARLPRSLMRLISSSMPQAPRRALTSSRCREPSTLPPVSISVQQDHNRHRDQPHPHRYELQSGADCRRRSIKLQCHNQEPDYKRCPTRPNGDEDGIIIQDRAHHVWVDHCTISNCDDEAIDISHASDYITVSWNHFHNQDKVALLGHSTDNGAEDTGHFKVTYHHNFFDETLSRHPRVRFSFLCHVYNNYYNGGPSTDYGIASTCDAYVLAEGNYFKNWEDPMLCLHYSDDPNGWLIERDNIYDNSDDPEVNPPAYMPEPSTYYSYTLDNHKDIPTMVSLGAGVNGLDFFPHWLFGPYGDFDRTA